MTRLTRYRSDRWVLNSIGMIVRRWQEDDSFSTDDAMRELEDVLERNRKGVEL